MSAAHASAAGAARGWGSVARAVGVAGLIALLAGCASWPEAGHSPTQRAPQAKRCTRFVDAAYDAIRERELSDAQWPLLAGHPYYRVNRLLVDLADEAKTQAERRAWLERSLALGRRGLRMEWARLAPAVRRRLRHHYAPAGAELSLSACVTALHRLHAGDPARIARLRARAEMPDLYRDAARLVGLYPLTRWGVLSGVGDWHREARQGFQRRRFLDNNEGVAYAPPDAPALAPAERREIMARAYARGELGIPEPGQAALKRLRAHFAPVFRVHGSGRANRIGRLGWASDETYRLNTQAPTVYFLVSHVRADGRILLQLNYWIWFPERPPAGMLDPYSGRLDGLIWRVTLNTEGRVLLYDSIHPCGCYRKYYPVAPRLEPRENPSVAEPPLVLEAALPDATRERIRVHLEGGTHFVRGVTRADEARGPELSYAWRPYDRLRRLPQPNGARRSLFAPDGIVAGTERGERWFLWITGVPAPGAMRQWGRHATAFVGKQYFDDPQWLEQLFRLEASVEGAGDAR